MNKYYVGQLSRAVTHFNLTDKPAKVELVFNNGDFSEEMPFKLDHEYYVIEKSELDAYMARPVFAENQRLKAKIHELEAANVGLRDINKSLGEENSKLAEENEAVVERNTKLKLRLDKFYGMTSVGEELRAENEKLKAENGELNKRISHLKVILEHDENRMAALITKNNKLRGTNNELNAVIVQLRQKLDIIGLTGAYDS